MTRRDTILMAVLINAGLLVILFTTAITDDAHVESARATIVTTPAQEQKVPPQPKRCDLDAVVTRHSGSAQSSPVVGKPQNFPDGIAPVAVARPKPVAVPQVAIVSETTPESLQITVKRGDTLDKIARANGTTVADLMETNGLASSRLQIGDVLSIPKAAARQVSAAPVAPQVAAADYYTICSGDNPWVVAMKFHVPLDDLLQLNGLDEEAARKLKPGDKIRIR